MQKNIITKFVLISFLCGTGCLSLFTLHEKSTQERLFTSHMREYRRFLTKLFHQDSVHMAVTSKALGSLQKYIRPFLNPESEAVQFYFKDELVASIGSFGEINVKDAPSGWFNYRTKLILVEHLLDDISIAVVDDNPKNYVFKNQNACIGLSVKNVKRAFTDAGIAWLLINMLLSIAFFIASLKKKKKQRDREVHDFKHSTADLRLFSARLRKFSNNPSKILDIARCFDCVASVKQASFYSKQFKEKSYNLNELINEFIIGFFEGKDQSQLLALEVIDKRITVFIDKGTFFKVLSNLMGNAYKEVHGVVGEKIRFSCIQGTDSTTITISNKGNISLRRAKNIFKEGFSKTNSSGQGLGIIQGALGRLKQSLFLTISSNESLTFSFSIPGEIKCDY